MILNNDGNNDGGTMTLALYDTMTYTAVVRFVLCAVENDNDRSRLPGS